MRLRSTELKHQFIQEVYKRINAYCAQGLTLNENREFSAVIEAIEYNDDERIDIANDIGEDIILSNYILAESLNIPFYIIIYKVKKFAIMQVHNESLNPNAYSFNVKKVHLFTKEEDFISWWSNIKQTTQPHPMLNGAQQRANQTIFDFVLQKYGYEWGGNVDGFKIEGRNITCIFDDISIGFTDLDNEKADPALFFKTNGPVYNTWYSTSSLAKKLNVPHILLTKNKNNDQDDRLGITIINKLTKDGVFYYKDIKPCKHIVSGIDNIVNEINLLVSLASSPSIE